MSVFSSIKGAIWGSGKAKTDAAPAAAPAAPAPAAAPKPAPAPTLQAEPISEAEMMDRIGKMPGADKLNWRTSIVDLMKLVSIDSGFANRKELAVELGMTDYSGTGDQNIALHHAVINLLAAEGGDMPDMLKD